MQKVTLYGTAWCGYCAAAKRLLNNKNIPYDEVDVTNDPAARASLAQRSGQRTVPQIWIGDTHVGGYDDLCALDASGDLAPLLEG